MIPKQARIPPLLLYLGTAALIAAVAFALDTSRSMSAVWYGPYLSAARNLTWGGDFLINLGEVKNFREMSDAQRNDYRFTATDDLTEYIANPVGYAYFIVAAKSTFFWLPDVQALKAFQVLLHTLLSILVIALLQGRRQKLLFLLLYALNPVVLYYATFPYYYFLQAIPSFGLIFLLLMHGRWSVQSDLWLPVAFVSLCVALAFVLLTRPTTLLATLAFFGLAFVRGPDRKIFALGSVLFVALVASAYSPTQKNFWHTAYIGVGAYPNSHMSGLSDDNGYMLFERRTGVPLIATLGGNYYETSTMAKYREISRDEYMGIAAREWPSLIRNATLNGLQGFSIGYLVGQSFAVHLVVSLSGLFILAVLLLTRQSLLAFLIAATGATFTPFYPPIPAYTYGTYALLAFGIIQAANYISDSRKAQRSTRRSSASAPGQFT